MEKNPSVTVGIPAYNEEANIAHLLSSLLAEKQESFDLLEIIVISDGSTDGTVRAAHSVQDVRIRVVEFNERKGSAAVQNAIVREAKGEILVMINADVLPKNVFFIQEIIQPFFSQGNVGIVGADTVSAEAIHFFERVIVSSHIFKTAMYKKLNGGRNIYLCHGRARAFSRALYQQIRWPEEYPEDAFSYLFCVQRGFEFVFAPNAQVVFRSPSSVADHAKQSRRFLDGKKKLTHIFAPAIAKKEYHIPLFLFLRSVVLYAVKNPIYMLTYILATIYIRLFFSRIGDQSKFEISITSKKVVL